MSATPHIIAIWLALSVPLAILVGRFLRTCSGPRNPGNRGRITPNVPAPTLHQPLNDGPYGQREVGSVHPFHAAKQ